MSPAPNPASPAVAPDVALESALRTVRDHVRYACSAMARAEVAFGQGAADAFDEALWLVMRGLQLPVERATELFDASLLVEERRHLLALVGRRIREREPTAYLLGEAWLAGLRFRADRRAIIPRSLLAECLGGSFDEWASTVVQGTPWPLRILDLCTGGGSLAIVAAVHFPTATVVATDQSRAALDLAAENVADHAIEARVELLAGDLYEALERDATFDLILCNPPYVCDASMSGLPPEFRQEPRSALAGGADGMVLVRRILAGAARRLTGDGILLLEIGHEAEHFESAFDSLEFTYLPVSAGERMVVAITREQLAAVQSVDDPPD